MSTSPRYRIVQRHDQYSLEWLDSAPWWRFWNREPRWRPFIYMSSYCLGESATFWSEGDAMAALQRFQNREARKTAAPKVIKEVA